MDGDVGEGEGGGDAVVGDDRRAASTVCATKVAIAACCTWEDMQPLSPTSSVSKPIKLICFQRRLILSLTFYERILPVGCILPSVSPLQKLVTPYPLAIVSRHQCQSNALDLLVEGLLCRARNDKDKEMDSLSPLQKGGRKRKAALNLNKN